MKKTLILIAFLFMFGCACFGDDTTEVEKFFNKYVEAANSYDENYFDYYSENAKIIRVVEKSDGTKKSVNVPLARYKKEAKRMLIIAKLRKYKNKYFNVKIVPFGKDYKISAMRMPSASDYKIPAHFIIGKDNNGKWKIKEESMNTRVGAFLSES